jgi:hypothetical protein
MAIGYWAPRRGYISEPSLLDCNHPLLFILSIYLLFQFGSFGLFITLVSEQVAPPHSPHPLS